MSETRLIVVRHGQSESNVPPTWTSTPIGYPLTPTGHEQARAAGEALVGRDVTAVYSSNLVRAIETSVEIGAILGLEPQVRAGLQEIHAGVLEGGLHDDVGPIAMAVFERWWREGDLDHGFEEGENGHQIVQRMRDALEGIASAHEGATSVVVSHGGAMIVSLTAMCDNVPVEYSAEHLLDNTAMVEIVRRGTGWHCASWSGEPLD